MKDRRLLSDYVKAHWYFYVLALLFISIANITQSYYPKVLGDFTDQLQSDGITVAVIEDYSLMLLAIGLIYGILVGVGQYTVMRLGRRFEFFTRRRLFRHFTALSENYYSKNGIGRLLSYVMNDVTSVRESISIGFNQTTNAVILLVSVIVMMALSDIPLYLIGTCIIPLLAIPVVVVYFGPAIRNRSMKVQESLAKMTESAEEQFGGIRVTKKFAVESIMRNRFGQTVDAIIENQLRLVRMSSLFQAVLPFLGALSLIVSILFGGYLTIQHQISLGNFVSLTLYLRMMVNPLQQIGNVINTMQRSRASLERINNLLAVQADIQENPQAKPLQLQSAGIRIKGLTFAYPDSSKAALRDIDLTIAPGKTVGIIGKTGSGKTTLVKLLLRIYDPPAGTIQIGNEDIRTITLESLRSDIAYVPQDGFLFSTTIRDNIAFHQRDTAFEHVAKASKQAQIYDNIMEFPDQFETKLGERGVTLSGGQRQRTSLARGFIKNAPILILDDSVSAVDAVTETKIIENLRLNRKNKTTIIIAHRISAIKHADEIIVMDEGTIVQRGTHHQLMAEDGIYAKLYSIQEEGTRYAEGNR
ncbi:putative multidrug resistance ABC transporter ATP-binding/permease protein YheI [Paenibacillus konkukensis]|uniref:Multidrug resistance ABC transporter ATP-binding/permease protein YheI n=1 Tax=Paenibacillus konkukensis TaxID=2020716 RepID=A0ABY4RJ43_9BACL|nr:ABC transporter ATP-binding protein [Paenibacillus konkukensis]UQZ82163.1 putative multidrug resistance ABC transporter ATP-binding/permease protein YheI [Paenibacillus konkukensis]